MVDACCGGGGQSEGVRRMGGTAYGIDHVSQVAYERRFGVGSFEVGDGLHPLNLERLRKEKGAVAIMSGPPCQGYSTACVPSDVQRLIPVARECGVSFHHYSIENAVGSHAHLSGNVCLLRGAMFGLGVDRGRYFETSFPMHLDKPLAQRPFTG